MLIRRTVDFLYQHQVNRTLSKTSSYLRPDVDFYVIFAFHTSGQRYLHSCGFCCVTSSVSEPWWPRIIIFTHLPCQAFVTRKKDQCFGLWLTWKSFKPKYIFLYFEELVKMSSGQLISLLGVALSYLLLFTFLPALTTFNSWRQFGTLSFLTMPSFCPRHELSIVYLCSWRHWS